MHMTITTAIPMNKDNHTSRHNRIGVCENKLIPCIKNTIEWIADQLPGEESWIDRVITDSTNKHITTVPC